MNENDKPEIPETEENLPGLPSNLPGLPAGINPAAMAGEMFKKFESLGVAKALALHVLAFVKRAREDGEFVTAHGFELSQLEEVAKLID